MGRALPRRHEGAAGLTPARLIGAALVMLALPVGLTLTAVLAVLL